MSKILDFISAIITELRYKITWPEYDHLYKNTIMILILALIFSVCIGLIDMCWKNLISRLYNAF